MFNWLLGRKVIKINGYKVVSTKTKFIVTGNGISMDMPKNNEGNEFSLGDVTISIHDGRLTLETDKIKVEGIK